MAIYIPNLLLGGGFHSMAEIVCCYNLEENIKVIEKNLENI
jgi:hypothetical protein